MAIGAVNGSGFGALYRVGELEGKKLPAGKTGQIIK
jgi:hypothetical protein